MNLVALSGTLHEELIEFDLTEDGTPRLRFSVASSRHVRTDRGPEKKTAWHEVLAFGDLALELRSLGHGSEILVRGHLDVDTSDRSLLPPSIVVADSAEVLVARKSR